MQITYDSSAIEDEIIKISKKNKSKHAIIIVLFKGKKLPRYCSPMVRNPQPRVNLLLNNNFSKIYFSALEKNPSIQDGVILIQLRRDSLVLKGFSYRVYSPPLNVSRLENMGSGYNSSFDFSGVKKVVCVYFINKNGVKKFINGEEKILKV